eukprot:3573886-Pyramimonas_sp.AAC.1
MSSAATRDRRPTRGARQEACATRENVIPQMSPPIIKMFIPFWPNRQERNRRHALWRAARSTPLGAPRVLTIPRRRAH